MLVAFSCGRISATDSGEVDLCGVIFASEADESCDAGFVLSGERRRVCQANAEWSSTEPTCAGTLY